jgi:hypothetical protein
MLATTPNATFSAFLSACAWIRTSQDQTDQAWLGVKRTEYDAVREHENGEKLTTYLCNLDHEDSLINAYAFGPIVSSAGDWDTLLAFVQIPEGGVTAYIQDAVYPDLHTTVPYPPLHIHHIHTRNPGDRSFHRFETHGDYTNIQNDGYAVELPAETCFENRWKQFREYGIDARPGQVSYPWDLLTLEGKVRGKMITEATINTAESVRGNLSWYLRLAYKITKRPCQRVEKLMLMPYAEGIDNLVRFRVADPNTTIYWWKALSPVSGRIVATYRHSHRARDGGVLMYNAFVDPSMLKTPISADNASLASIEAALAPHAPFVRSDMSVPSSNADGFDRYGKLLFDIDMRLNYGDKLTMISIYNGTPASRAPNYAGTMLHAILFFYYTSDDANNTASPARSSRMTDSSFCCARWKLGRGTQFVQSGAPTACDRVTDAEHDVLFQCDKMP